MKTIFIVLAIAALVAVSVAGPRNRGNEGHRGGGKGPRGGRGHHGKPCRIVFTNGTVVQNDCFSVGGLFVCEALNLTRSDNLERKPRHFQNVSELSVCKPKKCNVDTDCSSIDANSICSDKPVKPDRDANENSCFPDRPERPGRPHESSEEESDEEQSDEVDEDEETQRPRRCSISPAIFIAKRACLVEYEGGETGHPCRSRNGTEAKCNETVACTVTIAGKDAALHFCERPERPPRDFGGSGQPATGGNGERLTDGNGQRPARGNRPRPDGGNRPRPAGGNEQNRGGRNGNRQRGDK